jgi:hypothetical protein
MREWIQLAVAGALSALVGCGQGHSGDTRPSEDEAILPPKPLVTPVSLAAAPEASEETQCLECGNSFEGKGVLEEEKTMNGYRFRVFHNDAELEQLLEVERNGKTVHRQTAYSIRLDPCVYDMCEAPDLRRLLSTNGDLTGDGVPEVAILVSTGGNCAACEWWAFFSAGEQFHALTFTMSVLGRFEDLDGDGLYEAIDRDLFYEDWPIHGSDSCPEIAYEIKDDDFTVAVDRMRKPFLSTGELVEMTEDLVCENPAETSIYKDLLNLIYSGRAAQARDYFSRVYPRGKCRFEWMKGTSRRKRILGDLLSEIKKNDIWKQHLHKLYPDGLRLPM